jgi:hemerythrin-like metal-binding protein
MPLIFQKAIQSGKNHRAAGREKKYKREMHMSVIKWRDSYDTGIDQFDREHHKIVELINTMFVAIRDKSGREVIEKVSDDVLSYTVYHFANEEQMMEITGYPEFDQHVAEHVRLRQEAEKFQTIISTSFPVGVNELYRFI